MPALHYAWNTAGTQQISAFLPVCIHYHAPKAIHLFNRHLLIAYYVLGCREARKWATDKVPSSLSCWSQGLRQHRRAPSPFPAGPPPTDTKGDPVLTTIQIPVLGSMGNTEIQEPYVPKSLGPSA